MFLRETMLSKAMIRIRRFAVMPSAHRDRREIGCLLPHSPAPQRVRVSRFDDRCASGHSAAHYTSQSSESKPDTPGISPGRAAVSRASCKPALFVSMRTSPLAPGVICWYVASWNA
jgi:hypothetical protein